MSQNLVQLNGGRSQVVVSPSYPPGVNLSPQYTSVKGLNSVPTEWVPGGRPIYDRLPSASGLYKVDFGLDNKHAYVYIEPGTSNLGVGSMQVQSSGDGKFLTIQSGTVVWKYGQNPLNPVIIDLELLDMRSTRYLIAYQLFYDDSAFEAEYLVEDFSLSGYELNVESGTDSVPGWRYSPLYAFTDSSSETWRNYDGVFTTYSGNAYLSWQSEFPHSYTMVRLDCPKNSQVSGTASLFYQVCPSQVEGDKYCNNPQWELQQVAAVGRDSEGQYFEFPILYPSKQFGWKVTWSDPKISVAGVKVSGELTLKNKPVTPLTYCQLVAYPENVIPDTILNTEGEKIPLILCKLAYVDVNNVYEVEKIQDAREIVNTNHQPIADWLTLAQDETLTLLHTQAENFPTLWMDPETSLTHEYLTLSDNLITLSN